MHARRDRESKKTPFVVAVTAKVIGLSQPSVMPRAGAAPSPIRRGFTYRLGQCGRLVAARVKAAGLRGALAGRGEAMQLRALEIADQRGALGRPLRALRRAGVDLDQGLPGCYFLAR